MNKRRTRVLWLTFFALCPFILWGGDAVNSEPLTTVQAVDLNRYTGIWYEIAKIPNRFQKQCVGNTTAQYTLRTDGKIEVVNRCLRSDGGYAQVRGIAKVADTLTNARLKVSFVRLFGISLFWGDYWIIGLDSDYQWAVVGESSRKYGWVLSREPVLSDSTWQTVQALLIEKGYDPQRFMKTVQE
jgi:apolipoprotein D and lipocalin family protein